MKNKLSLIIGATLLATAAGSIAQTAVTDPVGYITLNVKAAGTLSFVSPSLVNKVEYSGVVASAAGNVLTFSGTPFTAAAYDQTAADPGAGIPARATHYVEITNGTGEGAWGSIVSNTANELTLGGSLASVVTTGTTVKIRKHVTIADIFGPANSAGLKGSDQISTADEIKVLDSESKVITSIFFFDDGGPDKLWVDADFNEVPNFPVEPQQGLYIQRKEGSGFSFVRVGHVKTGKTLLAADPGINILAVPRAVGPNFTLSNSNLSNTGNQSGKVMGSDQIATADVLKIQQADGSLKDFFFFDDGGPDKLWVDADFVDAPTEQLKEGTSFVLVRQASAGTLTWSVPAETITTTP